MTTLTTIQQQAIAILEKKIAEIERSDKSGFIKHFAIANAEEHIDRCKDSKYYAENFMRHLKNEEK